MQKEEYIVKGRAYIFALISCVAALALYWLFRKIWPVEPFRCADGWLSPSIGIQGACSHHGGVVGGDTMPWFMKFVGPIVGVRTFLMLSKKFKAYTVVVVGKYGASKIGECADLLEKAIVLNMCIEFQYLKKNETYPTKRTVKPYTLNYIKPEIASTLCVEGYCYTRKANRNFLLSRMTGVKIIETP